MSGYDDRYDYLYDRSNDVEPNTFYEPRTAIAPFYIISVDADDAEYVGMAYDNRESAEKAARIYAESRGRPCYVLGCVSISSCPPPVKASTRALV